MEKQEEKKEYTVEDYIKELSDLIFSRVGAPDKLLTELTYRDTAKEYGFTPEVNTKRQKEIASLLYAYNQSDVLYRISNQQTLIIQQNNQLIQLLQTLVIQNQKPPKKPRKKKVEESNEQISKDN